MSPLNHRWHQKPERGNQLGLRFMLWIYQNFGKNFSRLLLYPVVIYFFLTDHKARKASQIFLKRVYHKQSLKPVLTKPPSEWDRFKHFYHFGCSLVDSIEIWSDTKWIAEVKWHGIHHLERLNEQKIGALIVSAHLGNVNAMRVAAKSKTNQQIKVLMYTDHAQRFNKLLQYLNPNASKEIIPLEKLEVLTVLKMQKLIEEGNYLGVLADRVAVGSRDRTLEVPFLNKMAPFPQGPWILASLLKCPVYLLFCIRTNPSYFEVFIEPFAEKINLPRKQREGKLRQWIGKYVSHLEVFCLQYPHHWFNFYDFWGEDVQS